jgi:hypothetical protein
LFLFLYKFLFVFYHNTFENIHIFEIETIFFYGLESSDKFGDEDMLRPRLINRKFGCLDFHKYPPGNFAFNCKDIAIIIHSNCVIGLEKKIELMKFCKAWFI